MSVLESMQLGLIPIVKNVGEIKKYCIDNQNSIIFKDLESTTDDLIKLIKNNKEIQSLRYNAIKSWSEKITYREDINNAIESLCDEKD